MYKIGLLGLGTVGTGTAKIILNPNGRHPLLQELTIGKIGVRTLDKPRTINLDPHLFTTDLESIVNDPDIDIVVELIGGTDRAKTLVMQAIATGKHVVTANKALIAAHGDAIFTAAAEAGVYVLFEAAVGGGIPILKPLKQSLKVNRIQSVIGIINGTTNYILTEMAEKGSDFSDVLAVAQQLGYAEADPTADVGGGDAADKITILTSLAFGGRVNRSDVYCEGITQISAMDIDYAKQLGFVIKLLAIASRVDPDREEVQVRVHPTLLPKHHPLASVNGVYNAILVESDPLGQVMFFGPGAGEGATASAVLADILNILALLESGGDNAQLNPLLSVNHQHHCPVVPLAELETRFYVRFICEDVPGVIGNLGTVFGAHRVSLESIVQLQINPDRRAEIVVITHDVKEKDFRQALNEIQALGVIAKEPIVLRVLHS
ncbi:MAG: homoserine dehydrogenase [Synechococcaceae cyanobacterium RL_1_2]|nr:homoserine dehydrogenase [Synechococcaceae cyanobacterium RL_1_2]